MVRSTKKPAKQRQNSSSVLLLLRWMGSIASFWALWPCLYQLYYVVSCVNTLIVAGPHQSRNSSRLAEVHCAPETHPVVGRTQRPDPGIPPDVWPFLNTHLTSPGQTSWHAASWSFHIDYLVFMIEGGRCHNWHSSPIDCSALRFADLTSHKIQLGSCTNNYKRQEKKQKTIHTSVQTYIPIPLPSSGSLISARSTLRRQSVRAAMVTRHSTCCLRVERAGRRRFGSRLDRPSHQRNETAGSEPKEKKRSERHPGNSQWWRPWVVSRSYPERTTFHSMCGTNVGGFKLR